MKTLKNGACILAACAGLLAVSAAWSQGPGSSGSHEIRVDRVDRLSDFAWQQRREGPTRGRWMVGISNADAETFPGGNLGQERGDERGAFRGHVGAGDWYRQGREQDNRTQPQGTK